ncbi:phosphatase PAP2 family protein [Streptomyces hesseae]|uniref:Phosphatase PAP2 family protein n=1 Tax=Streptomyces hesseae TaxID=3075519 RepID=A0ABU2SJ13_9ACTN|nr:phosphatase PAP2 family protein [Streptomyces sp. DSM 40473]MDT0448621.1 phosphatase PAP2 family protein [Streptomyces sp. DSM 40473]
MSRRPAAPVVAALALASLAVLTTLVTAVGGAPFAVDTAVRDAALEHRAGLGPAAKALTTTGTGAVPYLLAAAAGWLASARAVGRTLDRALGVVAAEAVLGAGQLARIGLRVAVDRPRPPADGWLSAAHAASFPSGHATTSALAGGLLAWALLRRYPGGPGRAAAGCALLWAVGVALTRVVLGVHWASDLVGGWLLATGWLALTLPALARVLERPALPLRPWRRNPRIG